jgi:hypothetical protein
MPPLRIDDTFKKRLDDKPARQQAAILECVQRLGDDPRYPGLRTHPIQSHPGVFSARVDRANRVSFHWEDGTLVLRNHCNHDAVYRRP